MHPHFTAVTSSNIEGYFYMAERGVLLIAFKSGGTYAFEKVEQTVATGFGFASSKGKFFRSDIKDNYVTTKVNDVAVANLLGGLGTSTPSPQPRRNAPKVTLQSLLLRYPMLNAVF